MSSVHLADAGEAELLLYLAHSAPAPRELSRDFYGQQIGHGYYNPYNATTFYTAQSKISPSSLRLNNNKQAINREPSPPLRSEIEPITPILEASSDTGLEDLNGTRDDVLQPVEYNGPRASPVIATKVPSGNNIHGKVGDRSYKHTVGQEWNSEGAPPLPWAAPFSPKQFNAQGDVKARQSLQFADHSTMSSYITPSDSDRSGGNGDTESSEGTSPTATHVEVDHANPIIAVGMATTPLQPSMAPVQPRVPDYVADHELNGQLAPNGVLDASKTVNRGWPKGKKRGPRAEWPGIANPNPRKRQKSAMGTMPSDAVAWDDEVGGTQILGDTAVAALRARIHTGNPWTQTNTARSEAVPPKLPVHRNHNLGVHYSRPSNSDIWFPTPGTAAGLPQQPAPLDINTKLLKTISRRFSAPEVTDDRPLLVTIRGKEEEVGYRDTIPIRQRSFSTPLGYGLNHVEEVCVPLIGLKESKEAAKCAACAMVPNSLMGETDVDSDTWINCDHCQRWFHIACAKLDKRSVRNIDKFSCVECKRKGHATTYVRKSNRAHASIDYAGLNEGVVKLAEETVDHAYIQPIRDGTIKFQEENFPRLRPDQITQEWFERDGWTEPVVIPASFNPRPRVALNIDDFMGPAAVNETAPWDFPKPLFDDWTERNGLASSKPMVDAWLAKDYDYEFKLDFGEDSLGMVIPANLTVAKVAALCGEDTKVDVIDVKEQEGEPAWTLKKWADYYSTTRKERIRNIISLEVSLTKLGRLIKRPKFVRDIDLADAVYLEDAKRKVFPRVQFYCLMSVANCYTDFHIDFGGSSVYYHILKGRKTFFFIPPKNKHLKEYEKWCRSPVQHQTWLPDLTKECYRVDLYEGDTALIPSGWIHAVWTPEDSLVIGGNFLTAQNYKMQFQIFDVEKNTGVTSKFRYPHFQKVMWFSAAKYLRDDPIPDSVKAILFSGQVFRPSIDDATNEDDEIGKTSPRPDHYNARHYSASELDGLMDLARYLRRTALIAAGVITDGVTVESAKRVKRSIPNGIGGDPVTVVKDLAIWAAWKRGNEPLVVWAYPDADPAEGLTGPGEKKLSASTLKKMERQAEIEARQVPPERQSARAVQLAALKQAEVDAAALVPPPQRKAVSTPKTSILGPKRIACDACRKRRIKCKHKDALGADHKGSPVDVIGSPVGSTPGDLNRKLFSASQQSNTVTQKTTVPRHLSLSSFSYDVPPKVEHQGSSSDPKLQQLYTQIMTDVSEVSPESPKNQALMDVEKHSQANDDNFPPEDVSEDTIKVDSQLLSSSVVNEPRISLASEAIEGLLNGEVTNMQRKGRNTACDKCRKGRVSS
jgi:JmjC domain, hydroxylase/Jumonji helical domain